MKLVNDSGYNESQIRDNFDGTNSERGAHIDSEGVVRWNINDQIPFNDMLTDAENNIFSPFLSDMNNFYFTDFPIANSSNEFWSFPSWPSHLDHILITNELFNYVVDTQTVLVDWSLIGGLSAYDTYVSDHRPVIIKILFNE